MDYSNDDRKIKDDDDDDEIEKLVNELHDSDIAIAIENSLSTYQSNTSISSSTLFVDDDIEKYICQIKEFEDKEHSIKELKRQISISSESKVNINTGVVCANYVNKCDNTERVDDDDDDDDIENAKCDTNVGINDCSVNISSINGKIDTNIDDSDIDEILEQIRRFEENELLNSLNIKDNMNVTQNTPFNNSQIVTNQFDEDEKLRKKLAINSRRYEIQQQEIEFNASLLYDQKVEKEKKEKQEKQEKQEKREKEEKQVDRATTARQSNGEELINIKTESINYKSISQINTCKFVQQQARKSNINDDNDNDVIDEEEYIPKTKEELRLSRVKYFDNLLKIL